MSDASPQGVATCASLQLASPTDAARVFLKGDAMRIKSPVPAAVLFTVDCQGGTVWDKAVRASSVCGARTSQVTPRWPQWGPWQLRQ